MDSLTSPRNKLILAAGLLLALLAAGWASGADTASVARIVLGMAMAGAAVLWLRRSRGATALEPKLRLQVLARTGLSPRCGLALVEADGRTLLVAYGDGFAQFSEAPLVSPALTHRPTPRPGTTYRGVAQ